MSTAETVKQLLLRHLDADEEKVTPTALLRSELGAKSVDFVEFIVDLENEFEIEISEEDTEALRTVGDVVNYIEQRTTART